MEAGYSTLFDLMHPAADLHWSFLLKKNYSIHESTHRSMISDAQKASLLSNLKGYRRKYLLEKRYHDLDESGTRIMVNNLLIEVLGYKELEEVKTEYAIKSTYADYVVQVGRKKHFIVEVKAIQIDLSENHLRQAINYAANEGIDWVLLTNGRTYELYRVIFGKPITHRKVCCFDLADQEQMKQSVDCFAYLTRKAALSDKLEKFWKRFQALAPTNLARHLYAMEVVRHLRKRLNKDAKVLFPEDDIYDALHQVVVNKIEIQKPSFNSVKKKQMRKLANPNKAMVENVPIISEPRSATS